MNWPYVVIVVTWQPGVSVGVVLVLVIVAIPCTSYLLLIKNHLVQEKKEAKKKKTYLGSRRVASRAPCSLPGHPRRLSPLPCPSSMSVPEPVVVVLKVLKTLE